MNTADEYRTLLKREFEARTRKNPQYSLRAFARFLGVSSSRLSEIFAGKQGLSAKWAERFGEKLGLSEVEKRRFRDLAEAAHSQSKTKRRYALLRLSQAQEASQIVLQQDAFQVVSDWYHFAITELAQTEGFQSNSSWIARRLGVTPKTVDIALERLLRLGLMTRSPDGGLVADPSFIMTVDGVPSEAIKKFHGQVLERAARAIYGQTVQQRDFSAILLPMDTGRIPEAKEMIRVFRRGFAKKLQPMASKDSVYCLAVQFFRVDENKGA